MAILTEQYEPDILIKLRDKYFFQSLRTYNIDFESSVLDIEVIKDKLYSAAEIRDIIKNNIQCDNVDVKVDDAYNVIVAKQYGPSINLCSVIKIHTSGDIVVGPYMVDSGHGVHNSGKIANSRYVHLKR